MHNPTSKPDTRLVNRDIGVNMKWSNTCNYCGLYWTDCTCHERDYPEQVNYDHYESSWDENQYEQEQNYAFWDPDWDPERIEEIENAIKIFNISKFRGTSLTAITARIVRDLSEEEREDQGFTKSEIEKLYKACILENIIIDKIVDCNVCGCPTDKSDEICDFCISENYTYVIKLKPDFAEAYYQRGLAKYKSNQFELAISDFDKAIELNPDFAEVHYRRGRLKFWKSVYKILEEEYELSQSELGNLRPKRADIPLSDLNSSISDFDKAIELDPNLTEAYFYRARAKDESKQYASAVADFDKAIEIEPGYVEDLHYREIAKRKAFDDYIALGNAELLKSESYNAVRYFDKAIEMQLDSAEAYYGRGLSVMYGKGISLGSCRYESATSDFNRAIELTPNDPKVYYRRGDAKHKLEQFESAIADYDRAIELSPDFYYAYYHRGHTKFKIKQFESAIVDYDKTIEPTPDCVEPYYYRGLAKFCLSEYHAAIADFSIVI